MFKFQVLYILIGHIVTVFMIYRYRKGNKELLLASFGLWFFPLQIIKFLYDKMKRFLLLLLMFVSTTSCNSPESTEATISHLDVSVKEVVLAKASIDTVSYKIVYLEDLCYIVKDGVIVDVKEPINTNVGYKILLSVTIIILLILLFTIRT